MDVAENAYAKHNSDTISVKTIVAEDFLNFKVPSMMVAMPSCSWKCCREAHMSTDMCQNSELAQMKTLSIPIATVYDMYINNPLTKSIVFGGLEPFDSFPELFSMINYFRCHGCDDTFVIYTGYYPDELHEKLSVLRKFPNIICKFGRYIPDRQPRYDKVLGIQLASANQYAKQIS